MLSKSRFEKKHVFDFIHRFRGSLPLIDLKHGFSTVLKVHSTKNYDKSAITAHLSAFFSNIEKEKFWIISSKKNALTVFVVRAFFWKNPTFITATSLSCVSAAVWHANPAVHTIEENSKFVRSTYLCP